MRADRAEDGAQIMSAKEPDITRNRAERRNGDRRADRIWTQAERDRFIAELREARRDAQAVTVKAGEVVQNAKSDSNRK
jgi:hypothetical protein